MKISSSLFVLIAAATVYASAEPETSENNKVFTEDDIKDMKGDAYFNCYKAFKILENDCIPTETDSYTTAKLDSVCEKFNNEKCQNLKKDPLAALPECKELNTREFNDFRDFIDDSMSCVQLFCTKSEKNEYCPITNLSLFQGITFEEFMVKNKLYKDELPSVDDVKKIMDETCKSNKCREAIVETFQYLDNPVTTLGKKRDLNETEFIDNTLEFMDLADTALKMAKDEKCIATANSSVTGAANSAGETLMIGYTVVIATI